MRGPGRVLALALVVSVGAGCHPGSSVRERIMAARSSLVDGAYSSEAGMLGGANVSVFLLPATTVDDAARFWCDVVVPAGGTHDSSGVKVELYIQGGAAGFGPVAEDATCPTS